MSIKKNSIKYDAIIILLIFIPIAFLLYFNLIKINYELNTGIPVLIGLFGTLLGFVLTAFTILFMFDSEKNPALNKIKKAGLFNQIHERFITTIGITFVALVYSILYLFFSKSIGYFSLLNIIVLYLTTLVFLRVYRSLRVLYLIYKTI